MSDKCVVCKNKVEPHTGFVTESGQVCSGVCLSYINEQVKKGNLNEGDDDQLNEVQMIL